MPGLLVIQIQIQAVCSVLSQFDHARLSLTQDSQSETGVNLIERTDHNGVRRCNENQNFEYHPLALEAIHSKSNHHRYP